MPDPASQPLVELRDVTFRREGAERPVLDGVSLRLARGETIALLGPSGCGKTTLLRLVNGLLSPSAGEVLVEGRATGAWDPIALRRGIGYVLQDAGLFPHFSVARNVGLVPTLLGWAPARVAARVEGLLELVGLPPRVFAERRPRELSGGERQRVGVARALAADPPLLLLDEPFGALDPLTRLALQREFLRLQTALGKSALFVTHDAREALLVGTRVVLLDEGRVLLDATPAEFLAADVPLARAFREMLDAPESPASAAREAPPS